MYVHGLYSLKNRLVKIQIFHLYDKIVAQTVYSLNKLHLLIRLNKNSNIDDAIKRDGILVVVRGSSSSCSH